MITPNRDRDLKTSFYSSGSSHVPAVSPNKTIVDKFLQLSASRWPSELHSILQSSLTKTSCQVQMAAVATQAIDQIQTGHSIAEIHQIAKETVEELRRIRDETVAEEKPESAKVCALLENRLIFEVGAKSVDLNFYNKPSLKDIMHKFYCDESHPMDLQKYLRDPEKSTHVGNILNNLNDVTIANSNKIIDTITTNKIDLFNDFLNDYIEINFDRYTAKEKAKNVIEIKTVEPKLESIRQLHDQYYSNLGISSENIEKLLTFSTNEKERGIALFPSDYKSKEMGNKKNFQDENYTYLKVPDARNRVVRISNEGFKALTQLQKKNEKDLIDVVGRLIHLFGPQGHTITARTKSPQSILDKCGRITSITQAQDIPKYHSTLDIIDVNGCRITCNNPEQINDVIDKLNSNGFEFLELDNKYSTIRKDGAYKAIPCTIRDLKTGVIFELQIVTLTSITVTDIYHNVIYKEEAIGLKPTKQQAKEILQAQRIGAILETISLTGNKIPLTERMNLNSIQKANKQLELAVDDVTKFRRKKRIEASVKSSKL